MTDYSLENASLYNINIVNGTPVAIFDEHNMALPVWGTYSSRIGCSLNLVTFDTHTDTYPAFYSYLFENNIDNDFRVSVLQIPIIKQLLQNYRIGLDDFCFEDIYKLSCSYVKNTEQIITAYALGYINSYTVIHRDFAAGYEQDDRFNGLDARYINEQCFYKSNFESLRLPLALDFDLDYFRNESDMNKEFFERIKPLIKNASVITIAREPKYFESCKTDDKFHIREAEEKLIFNISDILNN